jgi:hypothetical protein
MHKFFTKQKTAVAAGIAVLAGGLTAGLAGTALADNTAQSHGVHVISTAAGSVDVGWRGVGPAVQDEVLVYNASTLQEVVHAPLQAGHNADRTVSLPAGVAGQALALKVAYTVNGVNTGWSQPVLFYASAAGGLQGAPGLKGDTGPAGPAGPAGASGVQALASHDFAEKDGVATGGSFVTGATDLGTFAVPAGTYEVCVNGKVEQPVNATGAVSEQLFLYDQAANSNFSGDLLNESTSTQGGTGHDAYLNGCTVISETSAVTAHLYAFGYDSDQGTGKYNVMSASVKLVQLTPAS